MRILFEPTAFDWDKGNIGKNLSRHNVADKEAEEAFEDSLKFIFRDEKHSQREERFGLYGRTKAARPLFIVFGIREKKLRIISARDMSRKERRAYEEKIKNYSKI